MNEIARRLAEAKAQDKSNAKIIKANRALVDGLAPRVAKLLEVELKRNRPDTKGFAIQVERRHNGSEAKCELRVIDKPPRGHGSGPVFWAVVAMSFSNATPSITYGEQVYGSSHTLGIVSKLGEEELAGIARAFHDASARYLHDKHRQN